jgi:putative heme iron utilization protein
MKHSAVARDARRLFAHNQQGVLSTLSVDLSGYPFGSVITFAPDRDGRPVILISNLAQHTHNIQADPRVSLTLIEGGDDIQASGRLTVVGRALPVEDDVDDVATRFYRRFPHATDYQRAHDFAFYRIEPVRARYIGGFGRIHWVDADALCRPNPFDAATEAGMINHMNADHVDAMRDYCRLFGVAPGKDAPRMSGVDADGFDLMLDKRLLRIDFDTPVSTGGEVRAAMVELARRAREPMAPVA